MAGWLARVVLSRAPTDSELESVGRYRRSLLDKVFLARVTAALRARVDPAAALPVFLWGHPKARWRPH